MCDTFVALSNSTRDGSVIFGKNSDREPNEAQVLEYHPPASHDENERLACTYLTIPQARRTHGVLISRPFWMWGAEMGANDQGLVIGNEAVFTRMPHEKQKGLTGMDLLRLALERAGSAREGIEVITGLLEEFGQGGACGYEDKGLYYHNAYILADQKEAWVLETAGPFWAGLKVKDVYAISNGLTIGSEFDISHPDLVDHARKKGWLKKNQTFNFKKCYSDFLFTTFSGSRIRRGCATGLLEESMRKIDTPFAFNVLRHHRKTNYDPSGHLLLDSVCVHGGNSLTRNASTTGSLMAHLTREAPEFWATGTAGPCTGIFKPVWLKGDVLPDLGPEPLGTYDPDTLWWQHETLHRSVLQDYSRLRCYREERDRLEKEFQTAAEKAGPQHRFNQTKSAFEKSRRATSEWIARVAATPPNKSLNPIYRLYWRNVNKRAGIEPV